MADEKKGTIYQQLNRMLNLDGFGFEDQQASSAIPQKKEKIIIKGTSPEEIHRKGLELEQKRELQNKFFRTTDRGFQKALQYEAARLPAYVDYEGMEYYPIISSALDLFMEECTTIGVNGKMLNIYSNKERIKFLLEEFFYDIVNVNVNLPFWTRNLPVKHDSIIPLLDGTEITIKELSERLKTKPDKEIWTYSIQDNTKNIVPSKVIWCDLTRVNTQIVRVNLDDNTYVETTPDHEFLLRNGKYVKACDLKSGDSLMPFYTIESKEGKYLKGYEKVYNPATNHHKFTHRLVSMELLRDIVKENKSYDRIVTHHKDFNKKNNHPSNLVRMTNVDHSELHGKHSSKILKRPDVVEKRMKGIDSYLRSNKRKKYLSDLMKGIYPSDFEKYNSSKQHIEHNKIRSTSMLKHWSDDSYKNRVKGLMKINLNNELLEIINSYLIDSTTYISKTKLCEKLINNKEFINIFKSTNKIKRDLNKSLNTRTINSMLLRKTGFDYMTYYSIINPDIKHDKKFIKTEKIRNTRVGNNNTILNHKVVSVEYMDNLEDVYCMEVVGPNGEHDRHNFPICSKNENGEYNRNGTFVSNCKYGDNFILLYGERKRGITHVKQLVNYEIERFERVQDGKPIVKFKERMTGDEFNVFEIAHFRLLGDDKYLPYGSCLLSDSYIKTSNGIKEIKDIVKGDVVYGFDIETQKLITSNVLDVVCNGEKNVFKISTPHNYVKATDNHKILIYDYSDNEFKYKFVSELKIGDGLIINKTDDYNERIKINKSVEIKEHDGRTYDDFVNDLKHIPDYIDEDFAKMFGFLLGDGGVNNKRPYMVYFAYGVHETINKKYVELLQKFSGKEIYLRKNKSYGNGIASAVVNSKSLATVLSNMEFSGDARNKRIPKWVYSTSKEIRKAFLEGIMDADGCVSIDKWNCKRFQIELSNYSLINDIKLLAQSLGYKTGRINKRKPRKKDVLINGNKIINVADSYNLYFYESENTQTKSSDIGDRKTDDFIVEKIKSIEPDGKGFVYDIHVDDENHNFFANNIVVHNSILNKIRRVFRQLVMAEDAMLTYRIIRAGEKKVFKIDVGNIDEDDIEEYIYKVATKFKKLTSVAPNDGQIDYRFNILGNDEDYFLPVRNANVQTGIDTLPGACLSLDTKIDLLDGRSLKLNEIIDEYNSGKELWSYSINPNTGSVVPGKITWAGVTRKNTQVLKLTLDNGESIIVTPDHKFPTKYNGIKEAQNLSINESLWAFNKKEEIIKGGSGKRNTYEMVYDHSKQDWVYTHHMVANYMKNNNLHENFIHKFKSNNKNTIHHKDFNRYNNNPNNLCWMNSKDHFYYHHDTAIDMYKTYDEKTKKEHKKLRKIGIKKYWNSIDDKTLQNKRNVVIKNSLTSRDKAVKTFNNNPNKNEILKLRGKAISKTKSLKVNRKKSIEKAKQQWKNTNLREIIKEKQSIKYSHKLLDLLIKYANDYDRIDLILENKINVNDSEWLNEFNLLNSNNKQLKKMNTITRNNIDKLLKYYGYSNWRDFKSKIPCYNHKIVSIEWLDEKQDTGTITIDGQEQLHDYHTFALSCGIFTQNSNLNQIQDIEYLRDNLFIGLGVPKPFLSFQDAAGGGKNLAQYDIRFAKKINRIQQALVQELNKMAMIHLYLLGYTGEDLADFTLTLTNPSVQQELLKSELMREKAQTYTELTRGENGIAAMSHTNAKKLVFNLSEREIIDDLKQQKMEKVVMQELVDSPVTIKKTGLFTDIDKKYGAPEDEMTVPPEGQEGAPEGGMPPEGGGAPAGSGGIPMMERKMNDEEYNNHLEKMVMGDSQTGTSSQKKKSKRKELIHENSSTNDKLNKTAQDMVNEIDELIKISESFNTNKSTEGGDDIDFEDFDDITLD